MPKIEELENGNMHIYIPISFRVCGARKTIFAIEDKEDSPVSPMALNLARAFHWQEMLDRGEFKTALELAHALNVDSGAVTRRLRMTLLSPKIIHRILNNDCPKGLTLEILRNPIPALWEEQERLYQC